MRIDADGKVENVSLENVAFAKADLPNVPGPESRQRLESITDIAFADGRVFVAGLSNEEFSSRLIAIPYPFSREGFDGAAVEIYHGSHGRFETKSPIRTFVTYRIDSEPFMLAAYTCTPLVKVPMSRPEGRRPCQRHDDRRARQSQPSARHDRLRERRQGLSADDEQQPRRHEDPDRRRGNRAEHCSRAVADKTGLGYETIADFKGAVQMDQLDDQHAVLLVKADSAGRLDLRTIDLP